MRQRQGFFFHQDVSDQDVVCCEVDCAIVSGRTAFQSYSIWESKSLGTCVAIDGDLQSTDLDRSTYHEALVHPAMLLHPEPAAVLVCGGGEGATIREVLRYRSVRRVVMVDIDREFVEACRTHVPSWSAGAFEDPRLTLLHEDVFDYVDRCEERFDVVIGDLTDVIGEVTPGRSFHGPDFYGKLARILNPGGTLATQAGALSLFRFEGHRHIRRSILASFPSAHSYRVMHDSFFTPWSFVVTGKDGVPDLGRFRDLLAQGFERHALDLEQFDPDSLASCFFLDKRIRARASI